MNPPPFGHYSYCLGSTSQRPKIVKFTRISDMCEVWPGQARAKALPGTCIIIPRWIQDTNLHILLLALIS